MGAVVDPRFVERIQGDIKAGCEKLEEYGYESLVLMVCKDKDGDYITGSQKGTGFLEVKNLIVPEFAKFCFGEGIGETKSNPNKKKTVHSILDPGAKDDASMVKHATQLDRDPEPMFDDGDDTDDYDDSIIIDTMTFLPLSNDVEENDKGNGRKANDAKEKDSGTKIDDNESRVKSFKKRKIAGREECKETSSPKVVLTRLSDNIEGKYSKDTPMVAGSGLKKVPPLKLKIDSKAKNAVKIENIPDTEGNNSYMYEDIETGTNDGEDEAEVKARASDTIDDPAEELECHFCLKIFSTNDALNVHMNFKHMKNRKDIKCPHCGKPCESSICLGDHLSKIHDSRAGVRKESYPCSQCKFIFSYRTHLVEHNQRNSKCKEMVKSQKGLNEIKDNILESKITFEDKTTGGMITKTVKDLINTDKVNTCEICSKSFDRTYSFRRHIFHHSAAKHFKCNICLCEFNMEEAMKRHWKLHDSKPYYCFNCYERYETRNRLNYHTSMSCKMMPDKPELKCPECGQQTNSKSALEQHKISCAGIGSATCEHCGKQLVNMRSLKRHCDRYHSDHTPFDCPECYRPYKTKEALKKHMTIHGEKKFKCMLCEYATTDPRNLQKHQGTHTGEKPFICDYCAKAYTRKPALDNHRRLHTGERPYKCDFEGCGKDFRNQEGLRQHQCYHSSEYKHVCDFCGRKFKVLGAYKHHRRYHTVEFRWPCEYCEDKFKSRMTYKTHIIKKHPEKLEETEQKCKVKYYRCNICPKVFSMPEHLQEHTNIHMGIKPIKCRFCGKGFSSKGNMLQHEKSHTGGKKYRCGMCPKSYSLPETFQEHLERRHGEKVEVEAVTLFQAEKTDEARQSTSRSSADNGTQNSVMKPEPARPGLIESRPSIPNLKQVPGLMEFETYDATAFIPVLAPITGETYKMSNDY